MDVTSARVDLDYARYSHDGAYSWTLPPATVPKVFRLLDDLTAHLEMIADDPTSETATEAEYQVDRLIDEFSADAISWRDAGWSIDDLGFDAYTEDHDLTALADQTRDDLWKDSAIRVVGLGAALHTRRDELRDDLRDDLRDAVSSYYAAKVDRDQAIRAIAQFDSSYEIAAITGQSSSTVLRIIRAAKES